VAEELILDHERDVTLAGMLRPSPGPLHERVSQVNDPREDTLGLAFVPVVDGETVIDFEDAVAAGHHRDTSLLLGTTYNEFATPLGADDLSDIAAALQAGGASSDSVHQFEAEANRLGPGYGRSQLMVQAMFRLPAVHIASERAATGSGDKTWLYDFRHRSPVVNAAAHCLELPFVWDQLDAPGVAAVLGEAPPRHLADTMHADWVGFITDHSCPWPTVSRSPAGARIYDDSSAYDPDAYRLEHELCTNRPD
jgi:para-nitrobenzyl esterase